MSIELVNKISPYSIDISGVTVDEKPLIISKNKNLSLLQMDQTWSSLIVYEHQCNDLVNPLLLNELSSLQFIWIEEYSCMDISSLTISNLMNLQVIICFDHSFNNTNSLTLDSITSLMELCKDLPNLSLLRIDPNCFYETTTVTLSSYYS